jgi:hypothetical protein
MGDNSRSILIFILLISYFQQQIYMTQGDVNNKL